MAGFGKEDRLRSFVHGLRTVAFLGVAAVAGMGGGAHGATPPDAAHRAALDQLSRTFARRFEQQRGPTWERLARETTGPQGALNRDPATALVGLDERGRPIVYIVHDVVAAQTIGTDRIWPGGTTGHDLDGSGMNAGEMGIWDNGGVLTTHVEFGGRVVQADTADAIASHATHTAGILAAAGVNEDVRGMAFAAPLSAYDWTNDWAEMATAAANGMLVSNHSYGPAVGWSFSLSGNAWYWYGDPSISETEDYQFGYYSSESQAFDEIAYNAPDYVIVRSGGNDRLEGPPQATGHYVWQDGGWTWSEVERNRDGAPLGYDAVSHEAVAKNVLAVGGVQPIIGGYNYPDDVRIGSFSSYGPTDDGRIKPDIVADGLYVESARSDSNTAYGSGSGTSVAAPGVAGSVFLLQELYRQTHGNANPLSSTIRGLVIHTADEAGENPGPDYKFGWGLMNTRRAADVIGEDGNTHARILERTLQSGVADTFIVERISGTPIRATLAWTDPAAVPLNPVLDDRTPMLVNDLDLRLVQIHGDDVFQPYMLDPDNPGAAPTKGDNQVDNVEQVYEQQPDNGEYRMIVSHKGILEDGHQDYSLIVSGIRFLEDPQYPMPRYANGHLDDTNGEVTVSWAWGDMFPPGYDLLAYDDGQPDQASSLVGATLGTLFEAADSCDILEFRIYTTASRSGLQFDVMQFPVEDGVPSNQSGFQFTVEDAKTEGWNVLRVQPNWLERVGPQFLLAFRSTDVSLRLGVDPEDNGHCWLYGSSGWTPADQTWFIRAVVQYADGDTASIGPSFGELDELDHFAVWRNGSLLTTTSGIQYTDVLPQAGDYSYHVTAVWEDGHSSIGSNPVNVSWLGMGVEDRDLVASPKDFSIVSTWPNPFNARMTAWVQLPARQKVRAEVFDILGRRVAVLADGPLAAGRHALSWDAGEMASGLYFLRLTGEHGGHDVRKITLLR